MIEEPFPIVSVALCLGTGAFDPDDISRRTGLTPTSAVRKGDLVKIGHKARRRADSWSLRVGPVEAVDVEPLFEDLRASLDPHWERLVEACAEGDLGPQVACVVELQSQLTPAFRLSIRTIGWMAELKAELDVDVLTHALRVDEVADA